MTKQVHIFEGSLPSDHYAVPCRYSGPKPSLEDLQKEFPGGVPNIFDGRRWRRHALAMVVGEISCEQIIWVPTPPEALLEDTEAIIAWAHGYRTPFAPNGYRPILGECEFLDLHRAHPQLCRECWMGALGSFVLDGSADRSIGTLCVVGDQPALGSTFFDNEWHVRDRFPFVRNPCP